MNILFITNGFPEKGNIGNGIFNYKRFCKLRELGHNVTVCKLNHLRDNSFRESYTLDFIGDSARVEVVNYYQIPKLNIFLKLLSGLKKIAKVNRIDIVHVHFATQAFAAYILKKSTGLPYIVTAHGSGISLRLKESNRYRKITSKAISYANHVNYVSHNLMKIAHSYDIFNSNESVIYNGVDYRELKGSGQHSDSPKRVIFVGNLINTKRSQFLPEIFKSVYEKYPNVTFEIIGDGPNRGIIKNKLKELNLLEVTNLSESVLPQEEVFSRLDSSDLLILPSTREGFGCVVIEAMMCGCQVVASNVGGIPEAVGDLGLLVDEGENWIERFSDAIISRLNSPLDSQELINWAKSFSWDKCVSKEIEVYKKVLNV